MHLPASLKTSCTSWQLCSSSSFGLIVRGDGDLLSSCQLNGLAILKEACANLWALQELSTLTCGMRLAVL